MSSRRNWIISGCAVVALAFGGAAWATIDNFKSYKQAYPNKEPKAYSCKICHEAAIGNATNLNGYGKALKQLPAPANPKKLTVEDYKAAEAADPDHDGATTKQELEAGTDPSDPASGPSGGRKPNASPSKSGSSGAAPQTGSGASTSTEEMIR